MKTTRLLLEKTIAIICAISFIMLALEYKSFPKETKIYYFLTLIALLLGVKYGLRNNQSNYNKKIEKKPFS
jgi:uncharacterized membrane protein SirB2